MIHWLFCIQTELDVRLHILFTLALCSPLGLELNLMFPTIVAQTMDLKGQKC